MKRNKDGTYANPKGDTITRWGDPDERLDSQYGRVSYREWCELEAKRMGAVGPPVEVLVAEDGKIALAEVEADGSPEDDVQEEATGDV